MELIHYLLRQSRKLLTLATVTGLMSGFAGASLIGLIGKGLSGSALPASLALSFFGLCVVFLIARCCSEISLMHLAQNAILGMRIDLSRKLLATPVKKLQAMGKPELLVILTNDIDKFTQVLQMLPTVFGNVIIIVSCLAYMAWMSWQIFLMFAAFLLIFTSVYHMAERGPQKMMAKIREQMNVLYIHFRDLIEGSKELQLNAQRGQTFVDDIIAPSARSFRKLFARGLTGYTLLGNTGGVTLYVAIGCVVFLIPSWFPQQAGILTSITIILLYLINPIGEAMAAVPAVRQAMISLRKIQQLDSSLTDTFLSSTAGKHFPEISTQAPLSIELRGVSHQYFSVDDLPFVLGPIDLHIRQGEILFIVGGNGSGKTTVAMLLLGLYEPEAGTILLNGTAVTSANLVAYRQHFSAVFADFHLFEQLLAPGHAGLNERASHYVKEFGMEHKVKVSEGKFSTIALSTGQRKRLALVSSYLEDRPVYLFDEWAADQDPAFKRVFYTQLLPELRARGKTVIIITHDDAYFSYADRVIKLEDGQFKPSLNEAINQTLNKTVPQAHAI